LQLGPNRYGRRPDAIVPLSAKTTFSIQPATSFYLIWTILYLLRSPRISLTNGTRRIPADCSWVYR